MRSSVWVKVRPVCVVESYCKAVFSSKDKNKPICVIHVHLQIFKEYYKCNACTESTWQNALVPWNICETDINHRAVWIEMFFANVRKTYLMKVSVLSTLLDVSVSQNIQIHSLIGAINAEFLHYLVLFLLYFTFFIPLIGSELFSSFSLLLHITFISFG